MTDTGLLYITTSVLLLIAGLADYYIIKFVWKYMLKAGINKLFVNLFNLIAFLLLSGVIALTIVTYEYLGNQETFNLLYDD